MCDVELKYGEFSFEALSEAAADPKQITSLDLSGNNLTPDDCIQITEKFISKMSKLESLDMKDNKIGPKGAVCLFQCILSSCPQLTYLDVNENAIQDDSLYDLAVLVKNSRIAQLFVVTNHITPRGLPTLCDGVVGTRYLVELSLAFNVLGDEGARIVADMLGVHPSLRTLDLSDNNIGDDGAVVLAAAFILSRRSRLESLNLSVNRIADVGFEAIGECLARAQNTHFTHLDLGCNDGVGDAGRAALIAYVPRMRYIESIDFTSCDLSDGDARQLCQAIAQPGTSLSGVEWYNNPRIQLPTERELFETIQAKQALRAASPASGRGSTSLIAFGVVAAALAVVAVVFAERRH